MVLISISRQENQLNFLLDLLDSRVWDGSHFSSLNGRLSGKTIRFSVAFFYLYVKQQQLPRHYTTVCFEHFPSHSAPFSMSGNISCKREIPAFPDPSILPFIPSIFGDNQAKLPFGMNRALSPVESPSLPWISHRPRSPGVTLFIRNQG